MRVATRRLRAAMEVFEPCFPRKRYRKALKRVKALADALGERRDRDVAIEFLEGFAAASGPRPTGAPLETLIERLREEQRRRQRGAGPVRRARSGWRSCAGGSTKLVEAAEA